MAPRGEDISGSSSAILDWDWLKSLDPKNLDEDDIEKLVLNLTGWSPNAEDQDNLLCMFKLASSALKSRDEDLNEAIEALGDKEADKEVKEENKKLKKELKDVKKENKELDKSLKRLQKAKTEGGGDEALDDLLQVEQALEQAQKETREMEKDLERERLIKDDMEKKVDLFTMEKTQLQRDVESLRDELENARNKTSEDGGSTGGTMDEMEEKRLRDLEETVRMKNKQIHSLLEDIEQVEKESVQYQNHVIELRDQMAETTKQINAMTGEFVAMKESSQHYDSIITGLQKENDRIRSLLEEMLQDKKKRDDQLDLVETEVEKRIDQMKKILEFKEATIEELRARLNRAALEGGLGEQDHQHSQQNVSMLTQALRDRDEQIEQLQEKLAEASRDIESSAALIEGFNSSAKKGGKGVDPIQKSLINVKGSLQKAEKRNDELEEALKEAEEAAKEKSEELSTTISQLRAYEKGEYGLEQAVEEARLAKKSEKQKEQKIEELTGTANHFQYQVGELVEEVNELREKLGLEPYDIQQFASNTTLRDSSSILKSISEKRGNMKKLQTQKQKDRALLQVLALEIERLEEERLQLKTENRKMARQLGHKAAELELNVEDLQSMEEYRQALKSRRNGFKDYDNNEVLQKHETVVGQQKDLEEKEAEVSKLQKDMVEYKTRYEDLFEENGELRRGMQQILEDVKEQDGKSDVLIHCPALEKLISILDARHLWGNYHPAMSLKAQIDKLEGANSELREQIRKARLEEDRLGSHLQRAKTKITTLENELSELRDNQMLQPSAPGKPGELRVAMPSLMPPSAQASMPSPSPHGLSATSSDMVAKLNMQLIQALNQLDAKEESCKILKEDLESQQNKLSVIRHQMGLLYEQFYQERKDKSTASDELVEANKQLEENLEAHRAKIEEYESHVDAFNNGEMEQKFADTTRKMVILRSNEALMIRRYRAVEESEKILRKENISLKDEMMIIENKVMEKIGSLQRHKEMATFKIESLQQSQADCVPSSTLKEANSQYADLTARYRHLLEQEQSHSANERRMEELELIVDSLRHEKATLNDELQAAREKLHSCEVMVTRLHDAASAAASVTGDESPVVTLMHDHQLESLTKQIATLELKELNEKQRADHAENKYKLIQAQTNQLEKRNEELEVKFADVTKANLELQRTERELRDTLVTSIAKERFDQLGGKVKKLESVENELRIENDKLKEVADVARNQIDLFETRKNAENVELEALRHEVIDLQSQTDEKSIIGKLHRQIVGFQLRDNEATNKIKQLQNKLAHAEALMFRLQQKADEKEAQSVHVRTQSYIKCRTLFKIIQDLRRQYSGSVPLSRQEKLSEILRELKDDKRKAAQSLKEAEDKLQEAETRADDLAVRQDSVDNLLNALKQGAGTKQVVEWQKRLEELRLRELRSRRQSERWSVEVDHLRELTIGQARRIDQLEEELVRVENQIEAKQLDWETRQVELETLEENGDKKQASAKNRQEQDALMIPNPEWPLAKQLEQSLNMVKAQAKAIDANGTKLTEARKLLEDFKKKLREAEGKVLAKNRIINDLRLQIPNSVDRAMTMASVTGNYGLPVSLTTDYESKQSLSVAQATVVSLRERLSQKEETVSRYERLLKQSRNDFENELRRKQEELVSHKSSIRSQGQVIQELKVSAHNTSAVYANAQNPSAVIAEKIMKIEELEDDIHELQTSLQETSTKLAIAKGDSDTYKRSANTKQKELDELKDTFNVNSQVKNNQTRQEVDKYSSDVKMLKRENALLQDELRTAKEALEKTPSTVMSSLVEKLRNDVAEKEKKQRAMGRIITDLKNELVNSAVVKDQRAADQPAELYNQDQSSELKQSLEESTKKIDDLNFKNDRLSKQLDMLKSKQISSFAEIKSLKEDLSKKGSLLVKLKEDKMRKPGASESSPSRSSGDKEKDELKRTIKRLEDRLRSVNKAEKPLEEGDLEDQENNEKQVRTAAELARWDESKKWLHKVELLKSKLTDADGEVSKLSKANKSLRDIVSRLEREKLMLENRSKSAGGKTSARANIADIKMKETQMENARLKEELEASKHNITMQSSQGVETLKLRNKFMQDRIEAQERKITALELTKKVGGDSSLLIKKLEEIQDKEKECQKHKHKLEEENMNLKLLLEQKQLNDPRITRAVLTLNNVLTNLRDSGDNEALALELKNLSEDLSGGETIKEQPQRSPKRPKEIRQLTDEIQKLKLMNEDLIDKLQAKNRDIDQLRTSKGPLELKESGSQDIIIKHEETGLTYAVPNIEEIRKMEADLKRKSDLLTEVKILLKRAADREREVLASKEDLSKKLKLVLEIDPKTPSEALAKELRLTRLTVERLKCEKKEMEHKLAKLEDADDS